MNYSGNQELMQTMLEIQAVKEGHFLLSSGKHSSNYVQCARLFEFPEKAAQACQALALLLQDIQIDVVAGPALGGVIISYEMGRQLGVRTIFGERQDGKMCLRRGFALSPGERVLIVEDVVTTGGSAKELLQVVNTTGATPVAVASIIDRSSDGANPFSVPFFSLLKVDFPVWESDECPLCKSGSQAIKPGSRPI